MSVFKRRVQRWLALVICVLFAVSLFPEAHAAVPSFQMAVRSETPRVLSIDIPTELASVEEWYQAPAKKNPKVIVHIQDAHANYEAQKNIRGLIEYLNTQYGFKTILVEGAASELDPGLLKLFPDQERNLKLVNELAKLGEVNGAEMFLVEKSDAAKGVGIEKPDLYRRNFKALQEVYAADDFTMGFFDAYEQKLGQIASRNFGPRMIQALTEWRKFENGHRDFLPFVSQLAELSKKALELDLGVLYSQIEWPQLTRLLVLQGIEKKLDQKLQDGSKTLRERALDEKQALVEQLSDYPDMEGMIIALERLNEKHTNLNRIGAAEGVQASAPRALLEVLVEQGRKHGVDIRDYPAFAQYAGYLILRSEIVPGALFEEIKKLFDLILDRLVEDAPSVAKEEDEDLAARKRLLLLHRDEMLARKLLKLELSHDEWLAIVNRQERFYPDDLHRRMIQQLGQNVRTESVSEKEAEQMKQLQDIFRSAFSFYSTAVDRETVFFQRMQQVLEENDKAILFTGGFHSEGMKYYFRKYDISYGTVTPRITQNFSNEQYRKVMMSGFKEPAAFQRPERLVEQSNLIPAALLDRSPAVSPDVRMDTVRAEARKLGWTEPVSLSPSIASDIAFPTANVFNVDSVDEQALPGWIQFFETPYRNEVLIGSASALLAGIAAYIGLGAVPVLGAVALIVTGISLFYAWNALSKSSRWVRNQSIQVQVESAAPTAFPNAAEVEVPQLSEEEELDILIQKIKETSGPIGSEDILKLVRSGFQDISLDKKIEIVQLLNNIDAQRIKAQKLGDETRVLTEMANLKITVAKQRVQEIRGDGAKEDAARKAIIQEVFDLQFVERLKRIPFFDIKAFVNSEDDISPAGFVAIAAAGFVSPDAQNKARIFSEILPAATSQSAHTEERFDEVRQMLQDFFPEMFVGNDREGRLVRVIDASDEATLDYKIQVLTMQAILNPKVKIHIILMNGKTASQYQKIGANLELYSVNSGADAVRLIRQRNGLAPVDGYKTLVVFPENLNLPGLSGFESVQMVREQLNHGEDLKAGVGMVKGAVYVRNDDLTEASVEEDGIDKSQREWSITSASLSKLKEVWQKFQAALQISRSA